MTEYLVKYNSEHFIFCSDGMGRTGVFITVMTEIERVKVEREVDIFQTVKTTRVQRPNMVSTVVSLLHTNIPSDNQAISIPLYCLFLHAGTVQVML